MVFHINLQRLEYSKCEKDKNDFYDKLPTILLKEVMKNEQLILLKDLRKALTIRTENKWWSFPQQASLEPTPPLIKNLSTHLKIQENNNQ